MFDTVMPHIPHQVRDHGIYISSLPCPAVYGSPGKMMPEIVYPGQVPFPCGESLLPYDSKVIAKSLFRIRFLYAYREKIFPFRECCGYPSVIADEIGIKFITDVNPPAFRPL
ncbi:MAG: hypothetical protein LUG62_03195 [Clostridiales bacterium]|nr:hypothetical protein [Clostridiales bacterium]